MQKDGMQLNEHTLSTLKVLLHVVHGRLYGLFASDVHLYRMNASRQAVGFRLELFDSLKGSWLASYSLIGLFGQM